MCIICRLAAAFKAVRQDRISEVILKYFLIAVILFSGLLRACFANEAVVPTSQAMLTVEVINGTANGTAVTDDEVIVQIYEHKQLLKVLNGKVVDGKAVFENIPTGEHIVAVTRAKHKDMMFNGQPVILNEEEKEFLANVQVFDVSYDKSKLSIQTHHLIIKLQPMFLEITEFMQLRNSSDMTVSSKERDGQNRTIVLEITLPKGFKNLNPSSYFEADALVITENGFYDIMAVPPGEYQIAFSYTLDITSAAVDIFKKITLPTSSFMIFAELGQAKLQGLDQAEKQIMSRNETSMEYYKLSGLAPNDELAFQVTGFNVNASSFQTWVILSLVFGVLVILAFLKIRSQKG